MTIGVQTFDANGNQTFGTENLSGVILGVITGQTGASGSVSNPALVNGTPFMFFALEGDVWFNGIGHSYSYDSSSTTLSWSINHIWATIPTYRVYYGVR